MPWRGQQVALRVGPVAAGAATVYGTMCQQLSIPPRPVIFEKCLCDSKSHRSNVVERESLVCWELLPTFAAPWTDDVGARWFQVSAPCMHDVGSTGGGWLQVLIR